MIVALVLTLATLTSVSCWWGPCFSDGTLFPTALPHDPPLWSPSANFNITILGLDEPQNSLLRLAFDQALILAAAFNHDLGYKTLHKAFTSAASSSTSFKCCMCLWALAYLNAPNLNRDLPPRSNSSRLAAAQDAAEEASLGCMAVENLLERDLVSAMVARFPANRTADNEAAFDIEFALRMGEIAATSVDNSLLKADLHAIFAEAVMNTIAWDYFEPEDGSLRDEAKQAKDSLELALSIDPGHVLALHLTIHLLEASNDPAFIIKAERAGDTLRKLIPRDLHAGIGHLLHMPGHAYTRAAGGRYHDAILANFAGIEDDSKYFSSCSVSPDDFYRQNYYTHKHAFLIWAAFLSGESAVALNVNERLFADANIVKIARDMGGSKVLYLTFKYEILLKFGRFDDLASERLPESTGNDILDSYIRGIFFFARSYALASQGNCSESYEDRTQFLSLAGNDTLRGVRVSKIHVGDLLDLLEQVMDSRLCRLCCDFMPDCSEVDHLTAAVNIQDTFPYREPRYWSDNVRACLGAALLRVDKPDQALDVFEKDLSTSQYPSNGWSLKGKELALRALGREEEAEEVASIFLEVWKFADVELDEPCF